MKTYLLFLLSVGLLSACLDQARSSTQKPNISSFEGSQLIKVKSTRRISSNHYSDLVIDNEGNSYIACFFKKEDNQDYILISKLSPSGELIWELGSEYRGRATAISIDEQDHIWVTGFFDTRLRLGIKSVSASGNKMFIAELDTEGNCMQILTNEGSGLAVNIAVNSRRELLISGIMGSELSFGSQKRTRTGRNDIGFIALFDQNQNCISIDTITTSEITRIISDQEGNFYLTGGFRKQLLFRADTISTTGQYDYDGFLIKVNGANHWLRQFGTAGIIKRAYRTYERGTDLILDSKGNIVISSLIQETPGQLSPDLFLITYNKTGKKLDQTPIARSVSRSIFLLEQDEQANIWLSGVAEDSLFLENTTLPIHHSPNSFIIQLNEKYEYQNVTLPQHKTNMLFRGIYSQKGHTVFSGHYQDSLKIGKQLITNDGDHELFVFIPRE